MTNQEITMAMFNAPSDQVVGETVTGPILGCVKIGYEPVLTAFADNFEQYLPYIDDDVKAAAIG